MTPKKPTTKSTRQASIRWTAEERPPSKRWWWYLGFVYAAVLVILITLSYQQWLLATLTTAILIAVLVVYRGGPRQVEAELTDDELIVNGQRFPLAEYGRYRMIDDGQSSVMLIPRRLRTLRVVVPLPDKASTTGKIVKQLDTLLALERSDTDLLDRLARWVRVR